MPEYFIPSWDEIENDIFSIAEKLISESFYPNAIVAILTGGVIPAKLFSDILGVKNLKYVDIKFYRGVNSRESKPVIRAIYANDLEGKNVLIVDDVSDTGETLEAVTNVVTMFSPIKVKTATIYVKPWSKRFPDYYSKEVNKWIIFPWDKWDIVRENEDVPVQNKDRFIKLMKSGKG
ncbi:MULTISPECIES: phosphoribosyltransferase [Acidianus]|uniref:Phosphoribosyltransferase n=1 Tax=Candidatus Acidianus copahuensis TaxID=1160895 RepID=A0A031LUL0_9CREN|nr:MULTISPECIES: phosphoribosyltransferase [Acidianus]EZQ10833.1 phosphoribosyltransferase [Candidatus Acidianus copahuensis]NON61222.1 phosphoribosyltransferase [Acidianus sp. RZ1]